MMKTHKKLLSLKKIKIAKIDSFAIMGKGTVIYSTVPCTVQGSRTPKEGRTQTHTYDVNCEEGTEEM